MVKYERVDQLELPTVVFIASDIENNFLKMVHHIKIIGMSRFFEKISAVKHKYKLEFTLIKLSMEMPLTEELSIVVKRGDHKK